MSAKSALPINLSPEGAGKVLGIGIDIIEVDRVQRACERHGDRFLNRIFTAEELEYCFRMKNPYPHLAGRFAAKEAVAKAFTTGIGEYLKWKSVSIYKGERNQPLVRLDEQGESLLRSFEGSGVLVSLAHLKSHANAVAVIYA